MYIPKQFEVTDMEEIKAFIQAYPFGTIVTTREGRQLATHVPLEMNEEKGSYYMTGHLAYANPQWKTFEGQEALLIYQGPHAYVSASWYEGENVSTWNYQAVHVYGTVELMNEQELEADLARLMGKYEQGRENPVLWENMSEKVKKQMNAIVGFKVKVEEVQAAFKLSQNRTEADYQNIIDHLWKEEDCNSRGVAEEMKKRR
ncbi:FMN-binding negative transcriptional regulator [Salimicrobium halophilum]|uniref:Negative transcriptional regulator, PaiB family n=1 Tax=Salimicrobium halophilum TaxID=86666 RepID=A0A1G8V9A1_9BACI|nr:FMN-binding negative transcriptional regulator [Salimicrobium halophilum]SDJ62651.1 negative transcriptional regulator, PaiB family [Salimicrobium halophilum]